MSIPASAPLRCAQSIGDIDGHMGTGVKDTLDRLAA